MKSWLHNWRSPYKQLAAMTGLNVRTIQRIERGQLPGLESKKSLAAVFEVDLATFDVEQSIDVASEQSSKDNLKEVSMNIKENTQSVSHEEKQALQYVKGIKEFYTHFGLYVFFAGIIAFTKGFDDPETIWLLLGWSAGVVVHWLVAYEKINLFTARWERDLVEKKLGKKL